MSVITLPSETLDLKDQLKARSFVYLPREGLQGEKIPSHILWENAKAQLVQIFFEPPLKLKEIFNAESYRHHNNSVDIRNLGVEGYVGLLFETSKVSSLVTTAHLRYLIHLSNGDVIKEAREIRLFRPQLQVKVETKEITVNPDTEFVKGRIGIKNIGKGTLIMNFSATDDSTVKLETPPEYREFAQKFIEDLNEELAKLGEEFPQFSTVLDEMPEWSETDITELSEEERNEFMNYTSKIATILASDEDLLRGFAEAYSKAIAKNTELIESVRKFIKVWESMVSKDVLLVNPFEEVVLTEKKGIIELEISQTDRIFDTYKDIPLPKIELLSSKPVRLPVYKLFDWG